MFAAARGSHGALSKFDGGNCRFGVNVGREEVGIDNGGSNGFGFLSLITHLSKKNSEVEQSSKQGETLARLGK